MLTGGGFFHPGTTGWDTPDSAQLLLRSLLDMHAPALKQLPSQRGKGDIAAAAEAGLQATDPSVIVDAAVDVLRSLKMQTKVRQSAGSLRAETVQTKHCILNYKQGNCRGFI